MNTAFVYAEKEVSNDELYERYLGTRINRCNSIIMLDTEGSTDDLQQFHDEIAEYTNASKEPVLVAVYTEDLSMLRGIVFALLERGLSVVFELDNYQRKMIGGMK
jgi:hypothetical protein